MTTHNDESLKPCPMCGKSVAVVSTHKEIFGEDEYYDDSSEDTFAVFCDASMPNGPGGCGASGGFARTEAEAIALWNRRAEQPQPAPMQVDSTDAEGDARHIFEEWHDKEFPNDSLLRHVAGYYADHSVNNRWKAVWAVCSTLASRAEHASLETSKQPIEQNWSDDNGQVV